MTSIFSRKQGQLSMGPVLGLASGIVAILVVGIIFVALSNVTTTLNSASTVNTTARNATENMGQSLANASANIPTLATVLVLVAIVSLILGAFAFFR